MSGRGKKIEAARMQRTVAPGLRAEPLRERLDDDDELTAQPMGLPDEMGNHNSSHEVGLSVDPDDLGRNFLSDATEQGNFESELDDRAEQYVVGGSRSDDALSGPNFESGNDVWENTVNLSLQGAEAIGPLVDDRVDGMRFVEDDDEKTESDRLDVTENVLQDASLLDSESDEYGETRSPELRTEDAHTHGRPRGGHAPRNQATRPKSNNAPRHR